MVFGCVTGFLSRSMGYSCRQIKMSLCRVDRRPGHLCVLDFTGPLLETGVKQETTVPPDETIRRNKAAIYHGFIFREPT
jgi:hypothetical protein